jgi:hypothetical protein
MTYSMIICLISTVVNLLAAMSPTNTDPWANWLAAGFCFGLLVAASILKATNR